MWDCCVCKKWPKIDQQCPPATSLLNSEIVDLPSPKQPAFILKHIAADAESPSQHG
ncbi:hypothetical protein SLEP1_g29455 [Rubroshorea leprosula]|uniref:Uncharacterized protein n=1 Tax=Rubroshorea leprosula TaxID=152421 RepID=A0AAV5K2P0_9ROSI|nr:hypothetical protein SLEP1_g29455 [Rubroshorea leprosula]